MNFILGEDLSIESNSFYDVFDVSEEQLRICKWMLGIETDKTSEELFRELQNS